MIRKATLTGSFGASNYISRGRSVRGIDGKSMSIAEEGVGLRKRKVEGKTFFFLAKTQRRYLRNSLQGGRRKRVGKETDE